MSDKEECRVNGQSKECSGQCGGKGREGTVGLEVGSGRAVRVLVTFHVAVTKCFSRSNLR